MPMYENIGPLPAQMLLLGFCISVGTNIAAGAATKSHRGSVLFRKERMANHVPVTPTAASILEAGVVKT